MTREEIKSILPHREPMLLVDGAEKTEDGAVRGWYRVRGDEWFLQGHFPGNPVVPGVILCEIMAQTCCALFGGGIRGATPFLTGLNRVKFREPVRPGDLLEIRCRLLKSRGAFYFAQGEAMVGGRTAAGGEFSFALV